MPDYDREMPTWACLFIIVVALVALGNAVNPIYLHFKHSDKSICEWLKGGGDGK